MKIQTFFRTIIEKGYMKIENNKWQIEASAKSLLEVAESLAFKGKFPSLVRQLSYYNFEKTALDNCLKFTHRSEIPLEHGADDESRLKVLKRTYHSNDTEIIKSELDLAQAEAQRLADANKTLKSQLEYEKTAHRNLRAEYHSLDERYTTLLSELPSSMRTDPLEVSGAMSADRPFLTDGNHDDNLLFDKVLGLEFLPPRFFSGLTPAATDEDTEAPSAFKDDTPLPKRTDREAYSFFGNPVIESAPPKQSKAIKRRRTAHP